MIVHCNHPKELSSEVIAGLRAIQECGIPLLNQAVLLKGVNDSVDVLEELCNRLVSLQIFPYYLHHTDAAQGNAHFRVSLDKGISLYQELRKRVSGIALPRYVIDPPTGEGKIDVERFIEQNPWAFKSEKEQNML